MNTRENGSDVESTKIRETRGAENVRLLTSDNPRNLTSENLRYLNQQPSPLMGMSLRNRKVSSGLTPASSQTFISANEHISNLLQSKGLSESASDVSVSSLDSSLVSPPNRRKRTVSTGQSETDAKGTGGGNLSRSSSTWSLASTGVQPLDSILKHLREKLCGQIFSGWYTERRYVDSVERYRDLIVVDQGENVIIKQVKYAIRKSRKVLGDNTYIGLVIADEECRLFVNLGASTSVAQYPFGHFWFQVRNVSFLPNLGFNLELVVIRQFMKSDDESCWRCRQRQLESTNQAPVKLDSLGSALEDAFNRIGETCSKALTEYWHPKQVVGNVTPLLKTQNLVSLVKTVCVLVMVMFTAIVSGLKHGANFALKTLHELAFLVERSTPLALGTLNILSKVVGGFYLLVAMIWRDSTKPGANKNLAPGVGPPTRPGQQLPALRGPELVGSNFPPPGHPANRRI